MSDKKYRIVLCGANAYDRKYYFNSKFDKIPENIKEELHIICVPLQKRSAGSLPSPSPLTGMWSWRAPGRKAIFFMMRSADP